MTLVEVIIPKTQEEKKDQLEQVSNPFFELPEEETVEDIQFINKVKINEIRSDSDNMLIVSTTADPTGSGTPAQNRTIKIKLNGVTLYILASTVAS